MRDETVYDIAAEKADPFMCERIQEREHTLWGMTHIGTHLPALADVF